MRWARLIIIPLVLTSASCSGDKVDKSEPVASPPSAVPTDPAGPAQQAGAEPRIDPQSGLVMADGFGVVAATCTTCHSGKLVAQNRGTRRDWDERLRWMRANHNLWELPTDTRTQILDYLAENYGIDDDAARHKRRRPLPAHLMPPTRAQLAAESSQ